jgi:hypothetical protein
LPAPSDVHRALTLSSGTLTGTGDVTVGGVQTWSGGTLSGSGRAIAQGGLAITGSATKTLNGRALDNMGAATWSGTGNIASGNGAMVNNVHGATLVIQNDRMLQFTLGGTIPMISNAGTLVKTTGVGTTTLQALVDNSGTVDVQSGLLVLNGGTSSGAFMVGTAATLRFTRISTQAATGTHTLDASSSVSGAGTVDFNGGTATVSGG